jgi:hypothetical protein
MKTRYTKNQAAEHEGILLIYGIDQRPDKHLVENLCIQLSDARKELAAYKRKSILRILWERITK